MTWKTIGLTDPLTKGPEVRTAQHELNHNPFGSFLHASDVDGVFGQITAHAVKHAKWLLGFRKRAITSTFGLHLHQYLIGTAHLPLTYRVRRKARLIAIARQKHPDVRAKMVQWCQWGIDHEPQIHYAQARPIPTLSPGHLPLDTDCSGSTIIFGHWAGVPPHPGFEYNGAGSSGDMGAHMRRISQVSLQPGDLVCWPLHHVAVCMIPGPNPVLESHGQEGGPLKISLSQEAAYHRQNGHGEPVFLSLL